MILGIKWGQLHKRLHPLFGIFSLCREQKRRKKGGRKQKEKSITETDIIDYLKSDIWEAE